MPKIFIQKPIVDINGDEMARVLWDKIKEDLILPYLDLKLIEYDLSIINRDKTNDMITKEAGESIKKNFVGVKCATIKTDDIRDFDIIDNTIYIQTGTETLTELYNFEDGKFKIAASSNSLIS